MNNYYWFFLFALLLFDQQPSIPPNRELPLSGAAQSLDAMALARTYPDGRTHTDKFSKAFYSTRYGLGYRSGPEEWEALGPKNIGGRTLCLAFHPNNPDIIFAGSASGGLWKSTTAGKGAAAWQRVVTGHPVLGVAAIAINPDNPDVIYIGTGEVYNYRNARPGIVWRFTRGSYGIGILKTVDGGNTWTRSLDWTQGDLRGIQDIEINPLNPSTLYAATTEGVYRSRNAGANWENIHPNPMAVDLLLNPLDTTEIFVTYGSFRDQFTGIYRSNDSGASFKKLTQGLPTDYTGKAMLDMSRSHPGVVYASIAHDLESIGLFRSSDGGASWTIVDATDVAQWQGWYSHDVAVHPQDHNRLMYVGIEVYGSQTGGGSLELKARNCCQFAGGVAAGLPEGPGNYVHSDNHRVYYHPLDPNRIFIASDGGIYVSEDGGESFASRNGGYQTTQFYADFANSTTDPKFAIGGMQDNSSVIYTGSPSWKRILGGDGMSAAIDPNNDFILYGSSQFLRIAKSANRGASFTAIGPAVQNEYISFSGPFQLAPSNPSTIYAGAERLYRSTDGGGTWFAPNNNRVDSPNPILTIGVSPLDDRLLYFSTAPNIAVPRSTPGPKVFRSINGGLSWLQLTGLPNRLALDFAFHPQHRDIVYTVFGGFNSAHVYKTTDGGISWEAVDRGLPDLPTHTIVLDPDLPENIYIGNDIGVYHSPDEGESWSFFSTGIPDAALIIHLSISPSNRKLRVATHGNGIYQTDLVDATTPTEEIAEKESVILGQNYPNPVRSITIIPFDLYQSTSIRIILTDLSGRDIRLLSNQSYPRGQHRLEVDLTDLPAGIYNVVLEGRSGKVKIKRVKRLLKL